MKLYELMIKIDGQKEWRSTGHRSNSKSSLRDYATICNAKYKIVDAK